MTSRVRTALLNLVEVADDCARSGWTTGTLWCTETSAVRFKDLMALKELLSDDDMDRMAAIRQEQRRAISGGNEA